MPSPLLVIGAGLRGLVELSRFRLVAVVFVSVIGAGVGRVTRQSMGVGGLELSPNLGDGRGQAAAA